GPRDDVPAVLRLGQVATDEHGAAPGLLDELGDLGRVVVLAQVGDEDVSAFPRVRDGDRPADPAVRAGDHRHLAGELAGAPVAGLPGVGHRIHLGLDAGRFLLLLRLTHAGGLPGPAAASPPEPGYRAFAVFRLFAFLIALTSSSLVIRDRPLTSSRFARSIRCALDALASTPPAVDRDPRDAGVDRAACLSDGPLRPLGSQWSPTFSNECFSAANAVRCARWPSPYSFTAESCALDQVSCAFFGERCRVDGSSLLAGMALTSWDALTPRPAGHHAYRSRRRAERDARCHRASAVTAAAPAASAVTAAAPAASVARDA